MKKHIFLTIIFLSYLGNAWAIEFGGVDIHGFISQGYLKSTSNNYLNAKTSEGSYDFSERGVNFSTELTDTLHLGIQIYGRDLGDIGNDDIVLDWAFADYHWKDWLGFRVGRIRLPMGLYNETRDMDMLRTNILLPQGVYQETWRDTTSAITGVGIYGEIPAGFLGSFDYSAQVGRVSIEDDGGIGKIMEDTGILVDSHFDTHHTWNTSVLWNTPVPGLRIGGSFVESGFDATAELPFGDIRTAMVQEIANSFGGLITVPDYMDTVNELLEALEQLAFGVSGVPTSLDDIDPINMVLTSENINIYTLSAEFTFGNLTIAAEYDRKRINIQPNATQLRSEVLFEMDEAFESVYPVLGAWGLGSYNDLKNIVTEELLLEAFADMGVGNLNLDMAGYYWSISYRFTDWFELGFYYTQGHQDDGDKGGGTFHESEIQAWPEAHKVAQMLDWTDEEYEDYHIQPAHHAYYKDKALSLRFDVNEYWTLKLEHHWNYGLFVAPAVKNMPTDDNIEGSVERWNMFAAKATFNF